MPIDLKEAQWRAGVGRGIYIPEEILSLDGLIAIEKMLLSKLVSNKKTESNFTNKELSDVIGVSVATI